MSQSVTEPQDVRSPLRPAQQWRRYYIPLNLLFLAVLAWTFSRLKWVDLHPVLQSRNVAWLVAATLAHLSTYAVESWAWAFTMGVTGTPYRLLKAFRATMAGLYLSRVTPARAGKYVMLAYCVLDLDISFGRALCGYMLFETAAKFSGWLSQAAGCLVALFAMTPIANVPFAAALGAVAIASLPAFGLLALTVSRRFHRRAIRVLQRMPYLRQREQGLEQQLAEFHDALAHVRWGRLAPALPPLIGSYFLLVLAGYLVFRTLASNMPYLTLWQCQAVGMLAGRVLPLSVGGVGTDDLTLVALADRLGYGRSAPLAFSIVNNFLTRVVLTSLGAIFWLAFPLPLKPDHEHTDSDDSR